MPQLVNGRWVTTPVAAGEMNDGAFVREPTRFHDWITPDGSNGPEGRRALPAEAGRYHLYVSYLCPWACRTLIFRALKGLEGAIDVSVTDPVLGDEGWVYPEPQDGGGHLPPFHHHYELYVASDPAYTGKSSVPVLWDKREGRIVNNESADIIRILNSAFDGITGNDLDLYPEDLRDGIEAWNASIYDTVNNGVYKAGFADAQAPHEAAVTALFDTLERIEEHLATHRYLMGEWLTEADWRLFVTLIRFDTAYHGAFKCNIKRLADLPNLSGYTAELYQWPGVRDTVRLDHVKRGYYGIAKVNPSGVVPLGPLVDFDRPHGRDHLPGSGIRRRGR